MNKADKYQGNTSLHWAVTSGNNIAVKLLIEAGADLNAINEKVMVSLEVSATKACKKHGDFYMKSRCHTL